MLLQHRSLAHCEVNSCLLCSYLHLIMGAVNNHKKDKYLSDVSAFHIEKTIIWKI